MEAFKWIIGCVCIGGGIVLLVLAFSNEKSKVLPFDLWDLLFRGTHIDESSSTQLAIEGALGIAMGAGVLFVL